MDPLNISDAEWRAYRAGRKERIRFMDKHDLPNHPPASSDLLVSGYDPSMVPHDDSKPFHPFNKEGDLTDLPKPMHPRVEQALKLNMMTAKERLGEVYGVGKDRTGWWPNKEDEENLTVATELPEPPVDMVNLPPHYARFKIEPIRFIGENRLDWFQGNIVKYVLRHDAKNGLEDIAKVRRYALMYERFLSDDPDWWQAGKPEDFKA